MATKAQATAACLLVSMMFFTFASGQLLTPILSCTLKTLELVTCGVALNLVKIGGVTDILNSTCCAVFQGLTTQQASKCLCIFLTTNLLGISLNLTIPGDINLLLTSCGKQVSLLGC